jgi:hypothetical protein
MLPRVCLDIIVEMAIELLRKATTLLIEDSLGHRVRFSSDTLGNPSSPETKLEVGRS